MLPDEVNAWRESEYLVAPLIILDARRKYGHMAEQRKPSWGRRARFWCSRHPAATEALVSLACVAAFVAVCAGLVAWRAAFVVGR